MRPLSSRAFSFCWRFPIPSLQSTTSSPGDAESPSDLRRTRGRLPLWLAADRDCIVGRHHEQLLLQRPGREAFRKETAVRAGSSCWPIVLSLVSLLSAFLLADPGLPFPLLCLLLFNLPKTTPVLFASAICVLGSLLACYVLSTERKTLDLENIL